MSLPNVDRMGNIERCADCGHDERADLYWHEADGEWVCDEVTDCRERQMDALRQQLRGAGWRRWSASPCSPGGSSVTAANPTR
jgi:hypothetical protein